MRLGPAINFTLRGMALKQRFQINRQTLIDRKSVRCPDCKQWVHPLAMTFDHLDRSTKTVSPSGNRLSPSKMVSFPVEEFNAMLDLCEAVCQNCHSIREARRDRQLYIARWKPFTQRLQAGAIMKEPQ